MHLDDSTKETAIKCFDEARPIIDRRFLFGGPRLSFKGIGTFGSRVVFAEPECGEDLSKIAELAHELKGHFASSQISLPGNKEKFFPHCTLMKVKNHRIVKALPSESWAGFRQCDWGTATLASVDLCSMLDKKDSDGYYRSLLKHSFGKIRNDEQV